MKMKRFAFLAALLATCVLSFSVYAQGSPDLDCWIEAPMYAAPGETWNSSNVFVKYRNKGDATATNVVLTLTLPANVTMASGTNPYMIGDVTAGTAVSTVLYRFNVTAGATVGDVLDWQVECTSDNGSTVEASASTDVVPELNQIQIENHRGSANFNASGNKVIFSGYPNGSTNYYDKEIFVYDIPGDTLYQLTSNNWCDTHPSYSPDGTRVVYQTEGPDENNAEIWVMKANGTNKRRVISGGGECVTHPKWTDDGRILFRQDSDYSQRYFTIWPNGEGMSPVSLYGAYKPESDTRGDKVLLSGNRYWIQALEIFDIGENWTGNADSIIQMYDEAMMGRFRPGHNQVVFKDDWNGYGQLYRANTDSSNYIPLTAQTRVKEYQLSDDEYTVTVDNSDIIKIKGVWRADAPNGKNYFKNEGDQLPSESRTIELAEPLSDVAGDRVGVVVTYSYVTNDCSSKPNWDQTGGVISYLSERDYHSNHQVWLMSANGKNKIRLTFNNQDARGSSKTMPKVSPNGKYVLFSDDGPYPDMLTLIELPDKENARTLVNLSRNPPSVYNADDEGVTCGAVSGVGGLWYLLLLMAPFAAGLGLRSFYLRKN
ncbi:MAG: hypothetical protein R6V10_01800 [bacterium]